LPKLSRITAVEAEKILLDAGFTLMRSKGSHRIYFKGNTRVVIPFHGSRILHPKIIKQVFQAIEVTEESQPKIETEDQSDRFTELEGINPLREDIVSDNVYRMKPSESDSES
jgi:predicted RNA binding protein YcfA (HicA-like mRNA interferase family)